MKDLVAYMARGLAAHPDDVSVSEVEGEASLLVELRVHPDDEAKLRADDGRLIHAMQAVAAAANEKRKAVVELIGAGSDEGYGSDDDTDDDIDTDGGEE